jgi:hypothetical protein
LLLQSTDIQFTSQIFTRGQIFNYPSLCSGQTQDKNYSNSFIVQNMTVQVAIHWWV